MPLGSVDVGWLRRLVGCAALCRLLFLKLFRGVVLRLFGVFEQVILRTVSPVIGIDAVRYFEARGV